MKKSTKILLIILGIVIVLGLGAMIVVSRYYGGVRADIEPPEGYPVILPVESGSYPVKNLGAQMSFGEKREDCGFVANWLVNPKLEEDIKKGKFLAENIRWHINFYIGDEHYIEDVSYGQLSWSSGMKERWCQKEVRLIVETTDTTKPDLNLGNSTLKFLLAPATEKSQPGTGACAPSDLQAYPFREATPSGSGVTTKIRLVWTKPNEPGYDGKFYYYIYQDGRYIDKVPNTAPRDGTSRDTEQSDFLFKITTEQTTFTVRAFHVGAATSCGERSITITNAVQDNNSVGYPDSGGQPTPEQGGSGVRDAKNCGRFRFSLDWLMCQLANMIFKFLGFFYNIAINWLLDAASFQDPRIKITPLPQPT